MDKTGGGLRQPPPAWSIKLECVGMFFTRFSASFKYLRIPPMDKPAPLSMIIKAPGVIGPIKAHIIIARGTGLSIGSIRKYVKLAESKKKTIQNMPMQWTRQGAATFGGHPLGNCIFYRFYCIFYRFYCIF